MPKKVSAAPSKGISSLHDLQESALELIGSKPDGIFQSELRKQLGIKSSKCSKIVCGLERSGRIKREPADFARRRTYLIRLSRATSPNASLPRDSLSNAPLSNASLSNVSLSNASPLCNIDANRFANAYHNDDTYHNIDTYLTEFYLLYLLRGCTSA